MSASQLFLEYMLRASKYALILLSLAIIIRCIRSMLREQYEPETWAYIRTGDGRFPVNHWENILGRAASSDVRIDKKGVSRTHAVLTRNDRGIWQVYDIFARSGVWVNGVRVGEHGLRVNDRDVINLGGVCVRFQEISPEKREKLEEKRSAPGRGVSPAVTLLELTLFQLFLLMQHAILSKQEHLPAIALGFAALAIMQWSCYNAMRVIGRSGFEVEILAFYLSTLGMSVAATSTPDDMYKQILLTLTGVILFLIGGWWLRSLHRTSTMRVPVAAAALALLAVNAVFSDVILGARNWLVFAGFSFQPSELVKVGYIYVGASTLDKVFRKRDLYSFILFSGFCVVSLALIGDFGTALIFFITFLVISYLRSGSIATVLLAVTGAGMAGFLAVSIKPYIARRFSTWGHVWEDVYGAGFQQTRAISAAAAGGLYGKGAGAGWLKGIFAANTDMVFALICEEQGLIIGVIMVAAMLTLAFFAVRTARQGRSAFYSIAACAAMSMLLVQLAMNVFGSLDLLPFTGVTFPFVSKGGTSLLSSWMMMAFIKSADNRRDASFAVNAALEDRSAGRDEDPSDWEVWQPREK